MIGKARSCPGGTALFQYVVNEEKGYELLRNGLSGITPKELYSDMSVFQQQNLRCTNNTISIVLSPTIQDGKAMSKEQLKELTKSFLKEMGLEPKSNQFIAFVHIEKAHTHVHCLICRVKPDGSLINDSFISKKAQAAAHKIALKHGWTSAKDIKESKEREHKESNKEVRSIIKKTHYIVLKRKPENLKTYQKEMSKFGIQVIPTINKQGDIQGYRFIHDATGTNLKASEVDRNLKLNKLFANEATRNSSQLDKESLLSQYNTNNSNQLSKDQIINEYRTDPVVFNSIISDTLGGEENPDEYLKRKKKRKQNSIER